MGVMRQVDLLTRDGGYVVTVEMPPFNPNPEAILWGNRCFIRVDADVVNNTDGISYVEGFLWVSPDSLLSNADRESKLRRRTDNVRRFTSGDRAGDAPIQARPVRSEEQLFTQREELPTPVADSMREQGQAATLEFELPEAFVQELEKVPEACPQCGAFGGAHKLACPRTKIQFGGGSSGGNAA